MGFDSGSYPGQSQPGQRPPYSGQWPPPQQPPQWQQPPPGWQPPGQPGPYRQPPRRRRGGAGWIFGSLCLAAVVIVIAIVAAKGKTPQPSASSPPATGAPAATSAGGAAAASTVTYIVTGSAADVTYGPAGSSLSGSVPLHKTAAIPASPPAYYSITAQLSGSGTVTCEIKVGGKVISRATATGSYQVASCEIAQDPFSGNWADANAA